MRFKTPPTIQTTLVIGSTLPALLYSYLNDFPIIINKTLSDNSYDFLCNNVDLCSIGFSDHITRLKKNKGFHVVGAPKTHIQDTIVFNLSMCGLIRNTFLPTSIRISNDDILTVFSKTRKYEFVYEKIHLFDCENISGIELQKDNITYEVYDKMDIKHSNLNDVEYIKGDDSFVSEIYIHPSDRNGAKKSDKDLVCKSVMTQEQLKSFDYSDTIARIKATSMMGDNLRI